MSSFSSFSPHMWNAITMPQTLSYHNELTASGETLEWYPFTWNREVTSYNELHVTPTVPHTCARGSAVWETIAVQFAKPNKILMAFELEVFCFPFQRGVLKPNRWFQAFQREQMERQHSLFTSQVFCCEKRLDKDQSYVVHGIYIDIDIYKTFCF